MAVQKSIFAGAVAVFLFMSVAPPYAAAEERDDEDANSCGHLPDYEALKDALVTATSQESSGLNNQMWATIVDRGGVVCAVAFSGTSVGAQWPGSRVISAQKANTGNAFSLDKSSSSIGSGQPKGLALSTANLYSSAQPEGSLFGLQFSNPVDPEVAYAGASSRYGTSRDPMVGRKIGGVNVFGGGLGLYAAGHTIVGGVGVSGDTSCADHNIGWRVRHLLGFDHMAASATLPAVPGPASLFAGDTTHPDNIIFDITPNPSGGTGNSTSGFGHPTCLNTVNPPVLPAVVP
jgi:uncharacterized protein GlcG (DUF336 family)